MPLDAKTYAVGPFIASQTKPPGIPGGFVFDEASTAFKDAPSLTILDPLHSADEDRLILIGNSHQNRLLVVVHTERGDKVRLISARKRQNMKEKPMEKMQKDPDMLDWRILVKGPPIAGGP